MTADHQDLLARLDLAAKVRLLTGASFATLHGDERIGLATITVSDGPTGVKGQSMSGGPLACLLPNATSLASTWDEGILHRVGEVLAEDALRQEVHIVLGPTINLHRSPLAGRVFESFSEDPFLTGRLAAAYVRGVQGRGVGTSVKHFVANEAETQRQTVDNQVSDAALREVYLLPFEIAVTDADPWTLMAAYNKINGVTATEHDPLLNGVVKGEWGYQGVVVSDWFATTSVAPAATGGLDLVMPGPHGPWGAALVDAVAAGQVPVELIDDHVLRLLRLADRVGALDGDHTRSDDLPGPTDPGRRTWLRDTAAAGMTILTNSGVLPLDPQVRVAVIGAHAADTVVLGGGSSMVTPPHQVSIADGLTAVLDHITVLGGVEVRSSPSPARAGFVVDPVDGTPGMHLQLFAADGTVLADDHMAEARRVIGFEADLPARVRRARLSVRVDHVGDLEFGVLGIGTWTVEAGARREEVVVEPLTGIPGEAILAPRSWTTVARFDGPTILQAEIDLGDTAHATIGLHARPAPVGDDAAIAAAVAAVSDADVAVVVVGLTDEKETESVDATTLALPGAQDAMVEAVAAAATRTVVVVNAATPVLMPWADRVDAVIVVGLPGQEAGHAVAAALMGTIEPAGRLVTSWPVADGATPAWSVEPVGGALAYAEGTFVGYRGHASGLSPEPHYWFGHGLGYGSWDYLDAEVTKSGDGRRVTVTVQNTSDRRSREVVQVYLQPAADDQPIRLVGWGAAVVDAGRTARVEVSCDTRMWRRWDSSTDRWADVGDGGALIVARGLGDERWRLPDVPLGGSLH